MSLIETLLNQRIILLTVGLAVLLLVTAVALAIIPRIKQSLSTRAAKRRAAPASASREEAVPDAPQAVAARASVVPPVITSAPAAPVPAAKMSVLAAAPAAQAIPATDAPVSAAMQDILSSVFTDEANSERQTALLRGVDQIEMSDLLMLSQRVLAQLHGDETGTVIDAKETI
ncbi:MAG: hypothetical protein JNJ61_27895 [Anaerolineae bacterium]|nr:hypothetical protein [Anaerolineae bacterium]